MYTATSFFLIALVLTVHGFPESHIVGGSDAPLGKYPYHVALKYVYQDGSMKLCGGSIINKRYILTAAHCVNDVTNVKQQTVHAGTIYLDQTGDAYQAESVVWHSGYNVYNHNNDIGLIRLNRDIVYSNVVKPIRLAQGDVAPYLPCVLTGWGATYNATGPIPNTLQQISLKTFPTDPCKKFFADSVVTDNHICTFTRYGEGACSGDSGSALVANGVQIGIASIVRNVNPCAVGYPDAFVKVSAYLDWIKDHMININ